MVFVRGFFHGATAPAMPFMPFRFSNVHRRDTRHGREAIVARATCKWFPAPSSLYGRCPMVRAPAVLQTARTAWSGRTDGAADARQSRWHGRDTESFRGCGRTKSFGARVELCRFAPGGTGGRFIPNAYHEPGPEKDPVGRRRQTARFHGRGRVQAHCARSDFPQIHFGCV